MVTTAVVGAASYFGSSFFAPRPAATEIEARRKLLDSFKEYEQQLSVDIPEINLITERLNTFSKCLDDYIRAFGYINHRSRKVLGQETLKVSSNVSSRVDPKVLVLTEKIDSIYAMLKSYPDVDIDLSLHYLEVDNVCVLRAKHHEVVKTLADSLFVDMDQFEREMEKCINAQKSYISSSSCKF